MFQEHVGNSLRLEILGTVQAHVNLGLQHADWGCKRDLRRLESTRRVAVLRMTCVPSQACQVGCFGPKCLAAATFQFHVAAASVDECCMGRQVVRNHIDSSVLTSGLALVQRHLPDPEADAPQWF